MNSFINTFDPIEKLIFQDGLRIKALHFHQDLDLMLIVLTSGKVLKKTISSSKLLRDATAKQLNEYRLIGKGVGIHWPQLDEDLSLKSFLQEALHGVVAI